MKIGKNIAFYRKNKKLTQQELAERVGVSFQTISSWERDGNQPAMDKLEMLVEALDIAVPDLFTEIPEEGNEWNVKDKMFSEKNMYRRIRTWAQSAGKDQTLKALSFAKEKHAGAMRKTVDGKKPEVPYIYHPLLMSCHALALGLDSDELIATILLHDVCEDCVTETGAPIRWQDLPFSEPIKTAVGLLTKPPMEKRAGDWEDKYYKAICGNQLATVTKILDRCNNLSLMATGFSRKKMVQYIKETEKYLPSLLNVLKRCDDRLLNNAYFLVKYQVLSTIENLKRLL